MNTYTFGEGLRNKGFDFYSGVPCSFLKDLINYAVNECDYVMAANEGDAVATCAGAFIGGRKSVFLCQNSGLTNAVSPLTSLNYTFKIPVLGFVSLRGEEGLNDEPQHELLGKITTDMIEMMQIEWAYLSSNEEEALEQLQHANRIIDQNRSFFFVVRKNTFNSVVLKERQDSVPRTRSITGHENAPTAFYPQRMDILSTLQNTCNEDTVLLATTGVTGRELYELEDSPNQFYMVGSMGCIGALSLGLAIARPDKKIICIDGDGSLLMRMGSLATTAYYRPVNLLHVLLDNGVHESTGGQFTVSSIVDFAQLARSSGYSDVTNIGSIEELEKKIEAWTSEPMLSFVYISTALGTKGNLGRPKIKPFQVKERLMKHLQ
ncbi:phosphonopyruvate decarboxylase [Cohnella fermenti]|uniref:Phosphonopyruvate decarboxylase n=1 Tax=Cohnella fermenti TaxID=2565925 RepID=A0A4S4BZX7_9BACL|nr:phosphonopyruvate decarboxylase [Cohnella fermenti]